MNILAQFTSSFTYTFHFTFNYCFINGDVMMILNKIFVDGLFNVVRNTSVSL